tara:strand:- start:4 stop:180 length:177 start_codon:yes stop_codon:yes gene_type:complete
MGFLDKLWTMTDSLWMPNKRKKNLAEHFGDKDEPKIVKKKKKKKVVKKKKKATKKKEK